MTPHVYLGGVTGVVEALDWLEVRRFLTPGARVFLKPNFTWKAPVNGVTTTPAFLEEAVSALRAWTEDLTIGESDGGYHSFRAEEAFASHGVYGLRDRYGVKVVNLSTLPVVRRALKVAGRDVSVELPRLLLEEVDVFVTLPVPKVHAMTRVSLGYKNQWGCQPGTMRLRNHPEFARKIVAINRLIRPRLALYDGTYFLDLTGLDDAGPHGGVSQTATTIAGGRYALSFDVDTWKGVSASVQVSAGGTSQSFPFSIPQGGSNWQRYTLDFLAASSSTVITLAGTSAGGPGTYVGLDNVSLVMTAAPVPGPLPILLLGAGLAGLVVSRFKTKGE